MLFRKPVKGDYVIYEETKYITVVGIDWSDDTFEWGKDKFTLVEVSPVEPPENIGNYYNLYQNALGNKVYVGGVSGYATRKEADRMGQAPHRVGCVDLNQLKGRFDD
jgi:hypothetical protein